MRGRGLVKVSFHHGQLVITGSGIAAHFYVAPKKVGGLGVFLFACPKIGQFEQSFGKIRIGAKSLLEQPIGLCVAALPLLNISNVKQARGVGRIEFQTLVEILQGFIEAS